MKFSILVPTMGLREEEIERFFSSLVKQTYKDFEVVIVSQINHLMVREKVEFWSNKLKITHIELIRAGLSYARNQGLLQCSGEWVILSDDDAWYPDDGLKRLSEICTGKYPIVLTQIYISNKQQKKLYKYQIKQSNKKRLIRISNRGSSWSNYSYSLYVFCDRLYIECKQKNINKIFFLAREGKFLKTLFDQYLQTKKDGILTAYLYASRNSTFIASMQDLSAETFDVLFRQYNKFSIRSFLKALCFTDSEIEAISCDNKDEIIIDFQKSSSFENLKSNDVFRDIYDRKRTEQKNNFIKHLKNIGYSDEDNINIVDVGWKGSMQDNIYRIMGHGISINGYYLGLVGQGNLSSDNDKIGLLFDWATNRSIAHSDIFLYEYILYEMILSADHGKTIGYNDNGYPIIKDDDDVKAYKRYVGKIQKDILNKFSDICKICDCTVLSNDDINLFKKIHSRIFKCISLRELNVWYDLLVLHRDSFLGLTCNEYSRLSFILKKKIKPHIRLKAYTL